MNNQSENKTKTSAGVFMQKKTGKKVFLSLHIMPNRQESKDTRVFGWLIGALLILTSLIIFLMIYV